MARKKVERKQKDREKDIERGDRLLKRITKAKEDVAKFKAHLIQKKDTEGLKRMNKFFDDIDPAETVTDEEIEEIFDEVMKDGEE